MLWKFHIAYYFRNLAYFSFGRNSRLLHIMSSLLQTSEIITPSTVHPRHLNKKERVKFCSTTYKVRIHHFIVFAAKFELVVFQKFCVIFEVTAAERTVQPHDTSTVVSQCCCYPRLPAGFTGDVFARRFQHSTCFFHTKMTKLVVSSWSFWCHFSGFLNFLLYWWHFAAARKQVKRGAAPFWLDSWFVRCWVICDLVSGALLQVMRNLLVLLIWIDVALTLAVLELFWLVLFWNNFSECCNWLRFKLLGFSLLVLLVIVSKIVRVFQDHLLRVL